VANALPRSRDYRSGAFLAMVEQLHDIITGHELPDEAVLASPALVPTVEPLPEASANEIIGLLEYLRARGGKGEVFRIAADTGQHFDQVIRVVVAAELLNFVDTPKRLVVLDVLGRQFLEADADQRKAIWREQLLKLGLFREIYNALQREPDHTLDRDFVLETIVLRIPGENYEKIFHTFINWSRYGDLFAYDETTGKITLQ
jgi:NitT/TauT family transport system ATP-binding protein